LGKPVVPRMVVVVVVVVVVVDRAKFAEPACRTA
jgi:hypothetical protein